MTKRLQIIFQNIASVVTALLFSLVFWGCKDDDPEPKPEPAERTILVYMIASNSLSGNEDLDLEEMKQAVERKDYNTRLLVYKCSYYDKPELLEVKRDAITGKAFEKTLKTYPESPSSASADRLRNVIADMKAIAPAGEYGLILWSHAMNWEPSSTWTGGKYWFGDDKGPSPTKEEGNKMEITELADALPTGEFRFIWADCCYMGSIECAWELKDKCDYYIAYPTETLATGCPYQDVLPHLLQSNLDIAGAARAYFDYYDNRSGDYRSATISVVKTDILPAIAEVVRAMAASRIDTPELSGVPDYARYCKDGPTVAYYDFIEYWRQSSINPDNLNELIMLTDNAVIYKAATPEFLGKTINPARYSGLSTHHFTNSATKADDFYKTLSWHSAIY